MKGITLTPSEREIMQFLWETSHPVSAAEIVDESSDKTWKDSYVHLLLTSLLKKEMIEVAGFARSATNYARTFKPACSLEEYELLQMKSQISGNSILQFISSFIEECTDRSLLDELTNKINQRRKELN